MTREEMIEIIVTELIYSSSEKAVLEGIEHILRNGFKGVNNFTDDELKEYIQNYKPEQLKFLKLATELIKSHKEDNAKEEKV